jgi:subfamily B ATP-binding cassette protein MsbA
MSKVATEAQEKSGFLTTYLVELFKNHKLTKIFQKESYEMQRAENHLHQLKEKTKKIALVLVRLTQ